MKASARAGPAGGSRKRHRRREHSLQFFGTGPVESRSSSAGQMVSWQEISQSPGRSTALNARWLSYTAADAAEVGLGEQRPKPPGWLTIAFRICCLLSQYQTLVLAEIFSRIGS